MWNSLFQFYNSTEWRLLRLRLINERTGADGILRDEWNGEPIIKAYDIIAHHKKPLTLQNVNDFSVSLNPENIMLVSARSHNEIHARFGFCAEQKVYYVWGAPGAGKTTWVNSVKGNSDLVVDADSIWEAISGSRYEKPPALNKVFFALHERLTEIAKNRLGRWSNCYFIEGGALRVERERKIALLGAEDIFIDADINECKRRVATRDDMTKEQKEKWVGYIDRWFEDFKI